MFSLTTKCVLVSCLSLVDCDPVCCRKPFVSLDVVDSVLQVAVTFRQIHLQQVSQQILQVRAEVGGEPHLGSTHICFSLLPVDVWVLYVHIYT